MTALLLLAPGTPMLFQGQEFAAIDAVPLFRRSQAGAAAGGAQGTRRVSRAVSVVGNAADRRSRWPIRPHATTFERCKLDFGERESTPPHTHCIVTCSGCGAKTRYSAGCAPHALDGAVLGPDAFVLRYFGEPAAIGC